MQAKAFLRLIAPLILVTALSCGEEGGGGGSDDDETSEEKSASTKKDAGKKDAGSKKDAGKSSDDEEEEDDTADDEAADDEASEDDEEEDKSSTASKDAGAATGCKVDDDCSDEDLDVGDAGIACCDKPTGMCFVSKTALCPAPVPGTGRQPAYN